jgi:8-oxo-dGTP pyrophosphatase MutT (NUDIX family)
VSTPGAHDFPVVGTELVHRGAVLALRVDEVRMPGGRVANREVVEKQGAVAVVALDEQGRVLLLHQYRHPVARRLWELPAGLLDVAGEEPVLAAARELAEEAGLAAQRWSVLVDVASSPGFTDEAVRVFLAQGLSAVASGTGTDDEESDLTSAWVPLADAVARVLSGEIANCTAVAGLLGLAALRSSGAQPRTVDAGWTDRPQRFVARGPRGA